MQTLGLSLLVRQDNLQTAERRVDEEIQGVREALISHGVEPLDAFKFGAPPSEDVVDDPALDEALADPEAEMDLRGVEYESPEEMGDADMRMIEEMLADDHVQVKPEIDPRWH